MELATVDMLLLLPLLLLPVLSVLGTLDSERLLILGEDEPEGVLVLSDFDVDIDGGELLSFKVTILIPVPTLELAGITSVV